MTDRCVHCKYREICPSEYKRKNEDTCEKYVSSYGILGDRDWT